MYKKRHRKDLTVDEVEALVAATKQPFRLHRDVAQQFRVSTNLVSCLVLEAERKPEKLSKKRDLERKAEEKRRAVEDVVSSMLIANTPIYSAQQVK